MKYAPIAKSAKIISGINFFNIVTPELINFSLKSYYINDYINQAFKIYEKKLKKNKKKIFLSFTLSFMVYNLIHKTKDSWVSWLKPHPC